MIVGKLNPFWIDGAAALPAVMLPPACTYSVLPGSMLPIVAPLKSTLHPAQTVICVTKLTTERLISTLRQAWRLMDFACILAGSLMFASGKAERARSRLTPAAR